MDTDSESNLVSRNVAGIFKESSAASDLNLIALVHHLARITAEDDYNALLRNLDKRYSGGLEKGPHS